MVTPLRFDERERALFLLDQRLLPAEERWIICRRPEEVAEAIRDMVVRGAPAIGIAAAWGVVLGFRAGETISPERFESIAAELMATRPTAYNLEAALLRMRSAVAGGIAALEAAAAAIQREDLEANRAMGRLGAGLLPGRTTPVRLLTHCNAGALATAGYGTALGVARALAEAGRPVEVFAPETRPFLQGARLTAWELERDRIPVTVITDGMVGALLASGRVDAVVVGADRVAGNGDVANKIGTYQAAVLAREHAVAFLVVAPRSTVDRETPDGASIPIEERHPDEVTRFQGAEIAPEGVNAWNPAFDVTPARLVTAIVTEAGVAKPPYRESLGRLLSGNQVFQTTKKMMSEVTKA